MTAEEIGQLEFMTKHRRGQVDFSVRAPTVTLGSPRPTLIPIPRVAAGSGYLIDARHSWLITRYRVASQAWEMFQCGVRTTAYAVTRKGSPAEQAAWKGTLIVEVDDRDAGLMYTSGYEIPVPGVPSIKGAEGFTLQIATKDAELQFGVLSRRFVGLETKVLWDGTREFDGRFVDWGKAEPEAPPPLGGCKKPSAAEDQVDLSVDVAPVGNSNSQLGARQSCARVLAGSTLVVDITLDDIPEKRDDGGPAGVSAFQFDLTYDPKVLRVRHVDTALLLARHGASGVTDVTALIPRGPGLLSVAAADFGPGERESGEGVLATVTFEVLTSGRSALTLSNPLVIATPNDVLPLDAVHDAEIFAGEDCP